MCLVVIVWLLLVGIDYLVVVWLVVSGCVFGFRLFVGGCIGLVVLMFVCS